MKLIIYAIVFLIVVIIYYKFICKYDKYDKYDYFDNTTPLSAKLNKQVYLRCKLDDNSVGYVTLSKIEQCSGSHANDCTMYTILITPQIDPDGYSNFILKTQSFVKDEMGNPFYRLQSACPLLTRPRPYLSKSQSNMESGFNELCGGNSGQTTDSNNPINFNIIEENNKIILKFKYNNTDYYVGFADTYCLINGLSVRRLALKQNIANAIRFDLVEVPI